jgi:hypothetical protein
MAPPATQLTEGIEHIMSVLEQITAYDYRGFALIAFPTGTVLVHIGSPEGRIVHQTASLNDAMRWVDNAQALPSIV